MRPLQMSKRIQLDRVAGAQLIEEQHRSLAEARTPGRVTVFGVLLINDRGAQKASRPPVLILWLLCRHDGSLSDPRRNQAGKPEDLTARVRYQQPTRMAGP